MTLARLPVRRAVCRRRSFVTKPERRSRVLMLTLVTLALSGLSGCGGSYGQAGASTSATATPSATPTYAPPTPTNVPPGWQVYSGPHFTIALPPDWSFAGYGGMQTGLMGQSHQFQNGRHIMYVAVGETYGFTPSQLQDLCKQVTESSVVIAGIAMHYNVAGGMGRGWFFINSQDHEYGLSAGDGLLAQDIRATDDAILATFRPDDPTSGCPK
jgi:hypothetical protein